LPCSMASSILGSLFFYQVCSKICGLTELCHQSVINRES